MLIIAKSLAPDADILPMSALPVAIDCLDLGQALERRAFGLAELGDEAGNLVAGAGHLERNRHQCHQRLVRGVTALG